MSSEENSRDPTESPLAPELLGGAAKFESFGRMARIRMFARSLQCPTGVESLL
jgi:hypothetical protein